jgi:folate-binding protein YgfZ
MPEHTPLHDVTALAGAVFAEDAGWLAPGHFGDAAIEYRNAHDQAALFDLSHYAKIEVTGGDAASFLHNLSTGDVQGMPVGAGCEAFLCTAKARVVAHVLIYHLLLHDDRDAYWLESVPGSAEKIMKHLDHFLISEQVEFADRTREFAQMHVAGPHARTILEKSLQDVVPDLSDLQHMMRTLGSAGTCHVRRHDGLGVPGYDIVCLRGRAEAVWQTLVRSGARPAGQKAYEALRIEAGTPMYGPDIDETILAPEVGRTAQAICYTKGCYIGQEPIVRIRDIGQVNRTLTKLRIEANETVPHGAKLWRDGKEAGQVTSSAAVPGKAETVALAYVRRGNAEPGTVLEVEIGVSRHLAHTIAAPPLVGPAVNA